MSKHYLVPVRIGGKISYYADTGSRYTFRESDIPFNQTYHGLCQKLNRLVLRNEGYPEKVFISREPLNNFEEQSHLPKKISVPFRDAENHKKTWNFYSVEISIAKEILNSKNDNPGKTIAIVIGAPREAAQNLILKIADIRTILETKKRKKGVKKNVRTTGVKTTKRRK